MTDDLPFGKRKQTKHSLTMMKTLSTAEEPLTAYSILDRVRPAGIKAPTTVYRSLANLIDEGKVHRIESLNAYVACQSEQKHCDEHLFLICRKCGSASELAEPKTRKKIVKSASADGFEVERVFTEAHGVCDRCQSSDE